MLAGMRLRLRGMGVKELWAALQNGPSLPVSLAPPTQENKLNDDNDGTITHSPEVVRLLEELRLAQESNESIAADMAQAEGVLADLKAERGALQGQLTKSEAALASSGALPEGAFPEEARIADVDRRIRVANSRVQLIGVKATESRANINRLKSGLRTAFREFITAQLAEVRERYRAAALVLREIYIEQTPWIACAFVEKVKVPGAGALVIADPEFTDKRRELFDSRFYAASGEARKVSPLQVQLTTLHAEVLAAIGETKAQSSKPAPAKAAPDASQVHGPEDFETFRTVAEAGARRVPDVFPADVLSAAQVGPAEASVPMQGAAQESPAGSAAGLPDLSQRGI